ncbi:hypothetical protein A374_07051 [Fictibacillus macauensis ZFHKF-1]|uniref:DUF4064 domain-containing protein n=1 Tax=Fictibacillus macauensis ZFHKF-1 TaxID=1196324 RepID=I8UGX6_9BACL|nr:DUF4064 domain-containing protein [Fictibacillus macauensis]EIT86058.1 hypothetical protein A374_07051 [Fictibacillus macauensis ZFHKF-1]
MKFKVEFILSIIGTVLFGLLSLGSIAFVSLFRLFLHNEMDNRSFKTPEDAQRFDIASQTFLSLVVVSIIATIIGIVLCVMLKKEKGIMASSIVAIVISGISLLWLISVIPAALLLIASIMALSRRNKQSDARIEESF